ncbi:methyl-accepting chemotaxis protein [Candidatus Allofournierella merdavium]|uniref:methyl-accepting chemotaxis protein n=1 Tax=Candidatus Allofournierella merdavium TaxID=2838593 RepID=UPI00374E8E2A
MIERVKPLKLCAKILGGACLLFAAMYLVEGKFLNAFFLLAITALLVVPTLLWASERNALVFARLYAVYVNMIVLLSASSTGNFLPSTPLYICAIALSTLLLDPGLVMLCTGFSVAAFLAEVVLLSVTGGALVAPVILLVECLVAILVSSLLMQSTLRIALRYLAEANKSHQEANKLFEELEASRREEQEAFARQGALLKQMDQIADQVNSDAHTLADQSDNLARGASEQATSMERLSNAAGQMTDKVKDTAGRAQQMRQEAQNMQGQVEAGAGHMQEMLRAMSRIRESSLAIERVMQTIDSIAFQTNILALNAAVEAARAGQAGKGFAVVADEVRSLASKSAEAAKGTGELIDQCLQAIENGNQVAGDTATALNSIKESVDMVAAHTGEISDMAAEQSDMVLNIHNEIESVSQVVQMTAASAQESSSTSRMLQQQAEQLRALSRSKTGPASV